ncbi:MAG: hypothetical protein AAGH71_04760 [Planctomycetota bacterium]
MSAAVAIDDDTVALLPDSSTWASLVADPQRDQRCAAVRAQLGLPTDRPIVMAGHQGQFWHAGIAVKAYAAEALAERIGGITAWLVVDTDRNEPFEIVLPAVDAEGRLERRTLRLADNPAERARPAMEPARAPTPVGTLAASLPSGAWRTRLAAMSDRLASWSSLDCAGSQATLAALSLLPCEAGAGPTMPRIVRASQLAGTDVFRGLVGAFGGDAARPVSSYNAAVRAVPGSGLRELGLLDGLQELPFWSAPEEGLWSPATSATVAAGVRLMPRALALTGLVRAFACDVFIHGTGGAAYEPVNDRWLPDLLASGLAPFVTATATLRLRFEDGGVPSAEDVARSKWLAHRARHQPGLLDDHEAQRARETLVARIREAPVRSDARAELFAELHRVLATARSARSDRLREIDREAAALVRRASERLVREDRTYPAALHDPEDLLHLRRAVRAAILGDGT